MSGNYSWLCQLDLAPLFHLTFRVRGRLVGFGFRHLQLLMKAEPLGGVLLWPRDMLNTRR